jgi:hypothetical protein
MKKIVLAVLLLYSILFSQCYEPPSVCGEKYQTTWKYSECYIQSKWKYDKGYFQSKWKYDKCYVQDKWKYDEGYIQDKWKYDKGYVKDKTIFGFQKD